jgi:hypothetical protein
MQYFSFPIGPSAYPTKTASGRVQPNLCFLHPERSTGHIVGSCVSEVWNIDALFLIPGWVRCKDHKKRAWTHYSELVFLHVVGSMGHAVHSGASVA